MEETDYEASCLKPKTEAALGPNWSTLPVLITVSVALSSWKHCYSVWSWFLFITVYSPAVVSIETMGLPQTWRDNCSGVTQDNWELRFKWSRFEFDSIPHVTIKALGSYLRTGYSYILVFNRRSSKYTYRKKSTQLNMWVRESCQIFE